MSTSVFDPPTAGAADIDLDLAAALVASQARMLAAPTLLDLWPVAADEALPLVESDGVAVVSRRKNAWTTLVIRMSPESDNLATAAVVEHLVSRGKLTRLAHAGGLTTLQQSAGESEQACLPVAFSAPLQNAHFWVLWVAAGPAALQAAVPVAQLVTRQVEQAAHSISERDTLTEAVAARHHIGMAQGMLMNRYGLTADQAFAWLRRQSQESNLKVRVVADRVLQTGRQHDHQTGE